MTAQPSQAHGASTVFTELEPANQTLATRPIISQVGGSSGVLQMSHFAMALLIAAMASPAGAAGFQAEFLVASSVSLENPHDLKLSPDGKYLYVSDVGNNRVAILDPETLDLVSTFGEDHQSGTHGR